MKKGSKNGLKKMVILAVLFCAFVAFLIISGRSHHQTGPENQTQPTTGTEVEATQKPEPSSEVDEVYSVLQPEGTRAEESSEEQTPTETGQESATEESERKTLNYEEYETEDPEAKMTEAEAAEDGMITNGEFTLDVKAVEKKLAKGDLYGLTDAFKHYLAGTSGENVSGTAEVLHMETEETSKAKTQIIVIRYQEETYEAKRNLKQPGTGFDISQRTTKTRTEDQKGSDAK